MLDEHFDFFKIDFLKYFRTYDTNSIRCSSILLFLFICDYSATILFYAELIITAK